MEFPAAAASMASKLKDDVKELADGDFLVRKWAIEMFCYNKGRAKYPAVPDLSGRMWYFAGYLALGGYLDIVY